MSRELEGRNIAILITNGFEQVEMTQPRQAFVDAGANTFIISPVGERVQGWNHYDKADYFQVDVPLDKVNPDHYDGLLLPGGVANPDELRTNSRAVQLVRAFFNVDKPVAAICHGPWTLIEAEAVKGRRVTSWSSLRTDLENAGAIWVDEQVVVDGNLLTSRNPKDLPAFIDAAIKLFALKEAKL